MITAPDIGSSVTMRSESKWAGLGINPAAGASGVITSIDGDWISVLWDGFFEPLNYRAYDLDQGV